MSGTSNFHLPLRPHKQIQQETRNGRTCIWQYLFHIRIEQIYPSRETKSEHAVVALLCGAQSI